MVGFQGLKGGLRMAALLMAGTGIAFAAPGYAGNAVCKTCHPDVWTTFYKNPHSRAWDGGTAPPEKAGCETCHGPGAAHVAARGGKATIVAFSQLEPRAALDACLVCHAESLGRAQIRRSEHTLAQIACNSCHSVHRSQTPKALLARRQPELCGGCHANVRAQFALPFKHRVNEGFMNCSDCHNPHGAQAAPIAMGVRPRMVDSHGNEEVCLKCHTDKRGPFAFEHPGVRVDGCRLCHQPHGSMNARLLRRPAAFTLCLECHNAAAGQGRQGDGIKLQSFSHNMADPRYRNCTTCHVRIHGSNADARFLR